MKAVLTALAAVLLLSMHAQALTAQTALQEVQVWYQPALDFDPLLVKWWARGRVRENHDLDYYGRDGTFRVIARVRPGTRQVDFVFRDARGHVSSLPARLRKPVNNRRDLVFKIPEEFVTGPLTLDVKADGTRMRFHLGTYVFCVPSTLN